MTSVSGLSANEAMTRLDKFGPNVLEHKKSYSVWQIFFSQFTSPLIYILLIAAFTTFLLHEYVDMSIILLAVIVNTVLGFFQEYRAQHALEALSNVLAPHAHVIRDGEVKEIIASEVVPGDILVLEAGEQIAGDGVFVEAKDVTINQAVLTGESLPVTKQAVEAGKNVESIASSQSHEAHHFGYMGTTCQSGRGLLYVIHTGKQTEIGQISEQLKSTEESETPLQHKLSRFSTILALVVLFFSGVIFVIGLIQGREWVEMFKLSVAVAVSAIPEGLVVSLTAILAIGMQRILKRKALVRKLVAAETLGSVSVICTDKTGTLTKGELQVVETQGPLLERLKIVANILSQATDALEVAVHSWGKKHPPKKAVSDVMDFLTFSSDRKYSAWLTKRNLYVVGAPDIISKLCEGSNIGTIEQDIQQFTSQGYRVVGVAYRKIHGSEKEIKITQIGHLAWAGFFVFADEIRPGIKKVFATAQDAGIDIKVITGDYAETAKAVMEHIGLSLLQKEITLGKELRSLSPQALKEKILATKLFARTTPDQKLTIVQALQEQGEVVAMTGDGVNDAPALKKADIGIVVSSATDVSKETADMVLLNDNFKTIIDSVEEGRGMFENLRKVILYLLSDAFSEIFLVIGSLLMGLPLPITAAQILWINLVDDGLPNLALTIDPKSDDLLQDKPRPRNGSIVNTEMYLLIGLISLITGIRVLVSFWFFYNRTGDIDHARTIAFTMLAVDSLLYVFSSRSLRHPIWKEGIFKNKWLILASGIGFLFQVAAIHLPFFQNIFMTTPLTLREWGTVVGTSFLVIGAIETVKWIFTLPALKRFGR